MERKRIAHVCPFYEPAYCGVKQVVRELAIRQAQDGHDVHVFTSDWDKTGRVKQKEEVIDGVKVHRCFHWFKAGNFGSFWPGIFLKILFWSRKFDVVHTHVFGHPHVFFSLLAGKIRGSRIVHTTHCPWSDADRGVIGKIAMKISYNTFSKWTMKRMDKIIAITPWELQFIEGYGGRKEKVEVIPNGMSDIFFEKIKPNNFRKRNGIPDDGKIILFFGRLNQTKNPDIIADIGKEVVRKRKNSYFVIRGPDEGMRKKLMEMTEGESQVIVMEGTRDRREIAEMYQAAEMYVLPSYREGLPLTLFEAMASGLPIIASPVNGVPYEMKDGVNGFLVDWRNRGAWEEKILSILDSRKLARKFRENNLKQALEYDWDTIAERTMEAYWR
jgi:glycosyltransferase involved in cell wall biosynthesis